MKKLFLAMAAAMFAANVNAQGTAITANKAGDNWYIGVNAGVATPMQKWGDYGFMKGVAPKIGVRLGKNLTTVFGLALDVDAWMLSKTDSKSMMGTKTFFNGIDVDLMGTFNLMNLFGGFLLSHPNFHSQIFFFFPMLSYPDNNYIYTLIFYKHFPTILIYLYI